MSTTMAMNLPIPSRHPARLLQTKSNETSTQATSLTNEQLDVWEHATVLYHGFDWQASAETFLYLSRTINRNLESTLCLLNAAMVFARCGEYATAAQILDEAEPDERTLAFTMFLVGHVEFELGHFEKAEDSLKVALHSLNGPGQRFDDLGLEYDLRASHIQQSLRIFESKNDLVAILGTLGALPADGVFEAPLRYSAPVSADFGPSTVDSRSSMDSDSVPTLTDLSSPSDPASPIESVQSLEYASDYLSWHGLPEEYDAHVTAPSRSTTSKGKQPATAFEQVPGSHGGYAKSWRGFGPFPHALPGLHKAHPSAYEPREARVQGDSVSGLADFIRALPSQNKGKQPKEAKVNDESTMELAAFLRTSGPGEAAEQPTRDDASDRSIYSDDERSDSVESDDLRDLSDNREDPVSQPLPSQPPHPDELGSIPMKCNFPDQSNIHPAFRRQYDTAEGTPVSSNLPGDNNDSSPDWPITTEASRSLRHSFVNSLKSRSGLPTSRPAPHRADVPEPLRPRDGETRGTGLAVPMRRTPSLFRRQNGPRPTSTVSSSRFFSHVANLK